MLRTRTYVTEAAAPPEDEAAEGAALDAADEAADEAADDIADESMVVLVVGTAEVVPVAVLRNCKC